MQEPGFVLERVQVYSMKEAWAIMEVRMPFIRVWYDADYLCSDRSGTMLAERKSPPL